MKVKCRDGVGVVVCAEMCIRHVLGLTMMSIIHKARHRIFLFFSLRHPLHPLSARRRRSEEILLIKKRHSEYHSGIKLSSSLRMPVSSSWIVRVISRPKKELRSFSHELEFGLGSEIWGLIIVSAFLGLSWFFRVFDSRYFSREKVWDNDRKVSGN